MIDMKLTSDQSPASMMLGTQPTEANGPQYPYGLTISLDNDAIKKLAIGELPNVGKQMVLNAQVEVIAVSKDSGQIEDGRRVELQITAMELVAAEDVQNQQQREYAQITSFYGND
jgi:hypothetical protein